MKKILLSTTAAILVATTMHAGAVNATKVTVAEELISITAPVVLSTGFMDSNTSGVYSAYVPSDIALTDLSNPIFNVFASSVDDGDDAAGTISLPGLANHTYCIVEDNNITGEVGDVVIAVATTTSGAKLSFDGTGATATNAHNYILQNVADSNATIGTVITAGGAVDANLTLTDITKDSFIRINLGSGDTNKVNDRGSSPITESGKQVDARMITAFDGVIDSTDSSYTFRVGVMKDLFDFNVTSADKTIDAVTTATDSMVMTFTSTNDLPAAATYTTTSGTCALDSGLKSLVCTYPNVGLSSVSADEKAFDVNITVNGTSDVILSTEFSAELTYDFVTTDSIDYTTGAGKSLLDLTTNPDSAGSWTYYGYNAIIPSINTSAGNKTYLKFNNDSHDEALTYWTVTGYDGCKSSVLVQADAMTFNSTTLKFEPTVTDGTLAAGTSALWNAVDIIEAANASGLPLLANGTAGTCTLNEKSSIEVLITTTRNLVHGTATMRVANQSDKIIPIYTRNQTSPTVVDDYLSE